MHIYRCDASATGQEQAHHRVTKGEDELLFCNHHWYLYQENFVANGWTREDVRETVSVGVEQ